MAYFFARDLLEQEHVPIGLIGFFDVGWDAGGNIG